MRDSYHKRGFVARALTGACGETRRVTGPITLAAQPRSVGYCWAFSSQPGIWESGSRRLLFTACHLTLLSCIPALNKLMLDKFRCVR